jgi:capsule polysaccharide modification protein KpsS
LRGYADTAESDAISSAASYTNAANTFLRGYADTAEADAISSAASYTDAANTFLRGYADTAESDAKTYANNTFLKLSGGTVTGNLSVVGNLNVSGNTYYVDVQEYRVEDPLIYLAANNYTSDLVDIGFIGNYVQGGANLHTAFYREHEDGEYYLIVGYNQEPANNHLGPVGTAGSTLAYLNANLKAQSITVNSIDVESHIGAAFTKANTVGTDLAGANTFLRGYADTAESDAISTAASYTDAANTFLRGYADTAESDAISTAASYTDAANTFLQGYADTAESDAISSAAAYTDAANTFLQNYAGTEEYTDSANTYLQVTFSNAANITSGTLNSGRLSGSYTGITGVGTLTAGTWNASTIGVPYGGTGRTSVTTNGIMYGQGSSALAVTSAGSEGQVLQAGTSGVPAFGDLDGGTF